MHPWVSFRCCCPELISKCKHFWNEYWNHKHPHKGKNIEHSGEKGVYIEQEGKLKEGSWVTEVNLAHWTAFLEPGSNPELHIHIQQLSFQRSELRNVKSGYSCFNALLKENLDRRRINVSRIRAALRKCSRKDQMRDLNGNSWARSS